MDEHLMDLPVTVFTPKLLHDSVSFASITTEKFTLENRSLCSGNTADALQLSLTDL